VFGGLPAGFALIEALASLVIVGMIVGGHRADGVAAARLLHSAQDTQSGL